MSDKNILRFFLLSGLSLLPFLFKRKPIKDWILVFFIKAFYSVFFDTIVVRKKKVSYPVRLLPKLFDINILYDLVLFPVACVLYNQISFHSKTLKAILQVFLFSIPMTITEVWAEKKTRLIKYHKGWSWYITFISLTLSFWLVRVIMVFIRYIDKQKS